MNYFLNPISQRGQTIFTSEETRGGVGICPIISLQMPEDRAKQIVAAMNLIKIMAERGKQATRPDSWERAAMEIVAMSIEKT